MRMNLKFEDEKVNALLEQAAKTIEEMARITMQLRTAFEMKEEPSPRENGEGQ